MTTADFPEQDLIDAFAENFFGYGDLEAPIWFIGMEEAGGNSIDEVNRRLRVWDRRGCKPLEDVADYHDAFLINFSFEDIPYQRTWAKLIRVILASEGKDIDSSLVRQFQKSRLGRHGSKTCLMELMPLPAPKTSCWPYASFSPAPRLANRRSYVEAYRPKRIEKLKALIEAHKPRFVVFYGKSFSRFWAQVSEAPFAVKDGYGWAEGRETSYISIPHPVAFGMKNSFFEDLGARMRTA